MADVNLASLNFKLHIDDDGFSDDIKKYIDMAQKMNTEVSSLLEGLGKVTSGRGVSVKRGEMLLGLREEIKQAERELEALTQAHNRMWKNLQRNNLGEIAYPQAEKTFKEQGQRVDELRAKLAKLQEAYKKLGGDKALAASFKETKKNAQDTNIELLQMREYYKQMASGANSTATAQKKLTEETRRGSRELSGMSRMWREIKNYTMLYFSFEGARRLVSSLVQVSAEFEKQRISLKAILQDADGAERIFNQIKELAVMSPFTFKELVTYTKQLSAFSIPMNELYDTTKMLADVSAGLGVGMDRLVLAYGQIRSASFLRGQEVRQLTEAGIPILTQLAEMFGEMENRMVSAGEVFDKISRRQVTFEMVEKVFKNMTSEGGKFYKMQEVLAQTLSGKLSNLKDAYQIMFAEIGEKNKGVLYKSVDLLRSMAENYQEVGKTLMQLVATYGAYRVATAGTNMLMNTLNLITTNGVRNYKELGSALKLATKETKAFQTANAAVAKLNPYALAIAGITALVLMIIRASKETSEFAKANDDLNNTLNEYNSKAEGEIQNLEYLFRQMKSLNTESEEYRDIRRQIISQYGSYLNDMDREKLSAGELTTVYDKLAKSIRNTGIEKMYAAGREKIADFYKDSVDSLWNELDKLITAVGGDIDSVAANELRGKILGLEQPLSDAAQELMQKVNNKAMNRNAWGGKKGVWWGFLQATTPLAFFGNKENKQKTVDEMESYYGDINQMVDTLNARLTNKAKLAKQAQENIIPDGEEMESWRKNLMDIAQAASDAKVDLGFTIDEFTELSEAVSNVSKEFESSEEKIRQAEAAGAQQTAASERRRLQFLKSMRQALGIKDGGGASSVAGASDDETKRTVDNIQSQIRVYQKLQEVYESLIETMSDEDARRLMEMLYPQYGGMVRADFAKVVNELGDELLELGMASEDAANAWLALQDAFSNDNASALIKSAEAAEKYREEIQKWIDEGYDLKGNGFSLDISKILRGLAGQNAGTDKTFEALKKSVDEQEEYYKAKIVGTEEEREKAWQSYKSQQYKILDDIAAHEKENNRKVAEDKINDLAQRYVNEMYKTNADGAIELSDWGDKSLSQITRISEALRHLMTQDLQLPKDIIDDANEAQVTLEDLGNLIRAIFTADYKTTIEERVKRIGNIATNVSNLVAKMGSSLATLGDNIENDVVKDFGDMLNVVTQISAAITDCEPLMKYLSSTAQDAAANWKALLNSGDLLTMAVKLLGIGMEQIVKHITTQYEKQQAIVEAAKEYKKTLDEIALSQYDGVLGVNDMGKLAEYYKQMSEASKEWASAVDEINRFDNGKIGNYLLSLLGEAGYDLKHLDLSQLKELYATLKQLNAQGYVHDTLLSQLDEYITKIESYEEAISDIFSKVADDIVDNLVDAFDEIGDSVANIEDAFYDLGDVILKSVLRSMVLENIVEKYKNDFMKAVTEYALTDKTENDATALAAQLGNITSSLREELEDSGGIFNAIIEAFRDAGLVDYNMDNEVSNTVGGGIKSITEDTANLLASYINAIRADVAAIRQAVAAGNTNTLPSPTLAEYLTQIQANTYNNAVAAQAILENLQSMMTMSDGPALRVFM